MFWDLWPMGVNMVDVEVNPVGFEDETLRGLNICFPGWGGRELYNWCFRREVGACAADTLVLRENGCLLAGSAVTYRQVRLRGGRTVLAGIMTGSWTLPESRGRGCFSRIIDVSLELTRGHRGALLLAFVTQDNKSYSRLAKAGAGLFPSNYVSSLPETPLVSNTPEVVEVAPDPAVLRTAYQAYLAARRADACVMYPDVDTWASQLVHRPRPTRLLRLGKGSWAAVEEHGSVDKIQFLVPGALGLGHCLAALLSRAQSRGQRLSLFSMSQELRDTGTLLGLRSAPGYLTALVGTPAVLAEALRVDEPWDHPDSTLLAEPESPFYLGRWEFQSGDRM